MTKQETYDALKQAGIPFEITEHKAVYNMAELADVPMPYPEGDAKNLFVRDDKHRQYYLLTVRGGKKVDLKEFRRNYGTRALSFASAEELQEILRLAPGSVTPLGLMNDTQHRVMLFIDACFLEGAGMVGVHPNDNTATVWLETKDLIAFLQGLGVSVQTMA